MRRRARRSKSAIRINSFRRRCRHVHFELLEPRQMLAGDIGNELRGTPRIVGGDRASTTYPWMISLQNRVSGEHLCGATLVAPDKAVTAAHCLDGETAGRVNASIGAFQLSQKDGQSILAERFITHPDYNASTLESDIAIVMLSRESGKTPIPFATPSDSDLFAPGVNALTMGWGFDGNGAPDHLQEVVVPIVSNEVANAPNAYDGQISENMMAAGEPGKDSCSGDSGGPLVVQDDDGNYMLVGVTSWGEGCGERNFPGIYARVENFTDFIEDPTSFIIEDDHGNSSSEATAVSVGDTAGRLTPSGDEDWFSFEAQKDDFFVLNTELGTVSDTFLELFDANNQVLAEDDDGGSGLASRIDWTAPAAGTYFLRVTSFDSGTGTYTLSIADSLPADDHGDSPSDATAIADGTHAGSLEVTNDSDFFSITAKAGATVMAEVQLGTLDDSVLTLTRSSGEVLVENDDVIPGVERNSRLEWSVDVDDTYFLEVSSFDQDFAGSYELVVSGAETDDHGNAQSTATPIELGSQIGSIESISDVDWFAISLRERTPYQITAQLDTLAAATVTVHDSEGVVLTQDNSANGQRLIWRAPTDGDYFVRVEGGTADAIGDYTLLIREVLDGDVNLDGVVNAIDLNIVGQRWLEVDSEFRWQDGDLDGNGTIDAVDLNFLGRNWLQQDERTPRYRLVNNGLARRQIKDRLRQVEIEDDALEFEDINDRSQHNVDSFFATSYDDRAVRGRLRRISHRNIR